MDFREIYQGLPNERVTFGGDTKLKLSNGWLVQPLPYFGDRQLSNSIEIVVKSSSESTDDAYATITKNAHGDLVDPWGVTGKLSEEDKKTVSTILSRIPKV